LRIRDLTCEADDLLLQVRGQAAAVLENVRARGWPSSGHSAAIGVSGGAYLGCDGCEFLGGYDRHANFAVSVRGDAVVTFRGCLFADLQAAIGGWSGASAKSVAHFDECTFENTRLADSRILHRDKPEFPITVRGGRASFDPVEEWGAKYAASVEGLHFEGRIPRCTVGDLLRVARTVPLRPGERLVAVQLHRIVREPPARFVAYIQDGPGHGEPVLATLTDGRVDLVRDREAVRDVWRHMSPTAHGYQGLPFAEILARSAVASDAEAYAIEEAVVEGRPVVHVWGQRFDIPMSLDGRTGEPLRPR
jgi:hypothetical protein